MKHSPRIMASVISKTSITPLSYKKSFVAYVYDYLSKFCTNDKTLPNLMEYKAFDDNYVEFEKMMFTYYSRESAFKKQLTVFVDKYKNDSMCLFLARMTFYRYIERTGKYELAYNSNILDKK